MTAIGVENLTPSQDVIVSNGFDGAFSFLAVEPAVEPAECCCECLACPRAVGRRERLEELLGEGWQVLRVAAVTVGVNREQPPLVEPLEVPPQGNPVLSARR